MAKQPDADPPYSARVQEILNRVQHPLEMAEVSRQLVNAQNELRKLTGGANEMLAYIKELEGENARLEGELDAALTRLARLEAPAAPEPKKRNAGSRARRGKAPAASDGE